ncbi:uncharacterized protein LOC128953530 [Oppia nitens]|uniref:uncharacterized protein LOC128953530 n=1 Tax=Oppia nitens TaxID=1686743 RepID=UPI0023DC2BDC|nr:uncharacterized protein LOC128953530 [Oppia nitens]
MSSGQYRRPIGGTGRTLNGGGGGNHRYTDNNKDGGGGVGNVGVVGDGSGGGSGGRRHHHQRYTGRTSGGTDHHHRRSTTTPSLSSVSSSAIDESLGRVAQLEPKCEQIYRLIVANVSTDSTLGYERQLWNDIKQYRHEKDTMLIKYLIGFYVTLIEAIVVNDSQRPDSNNTNSKQPYHLFVRKGGRLSPITRLLLYNILIRIGDLNRYLNRTPNADNYYQMARNLDVSRGHAYNQLAINTPPSQPLKCIYYYCRAAKSSVDPIVIAETNLKVAISRFDSDILKAIIIKKKELSPPLSPTTTATNQTIDDQLVPTYPQKGIDWFYLSVICMYCENFEPLIKPLIQFLVTHCELTANKQLDSYGNSSSNGNNNGNSNTDLGFALIAIDIAIDYCSIRCLERQFGDSYGKELRTLKSTIKICSDVLATDHSDDSSSSSGSGGSSRRRRSPVDENHSSKAMFHDYSLRGFSPLANIHKNLVFNDDDDDNNDDKPQEQQPHAIIDAYQLMSRVCHKLDKLLAKSAKPVRRMRNVALGSILENESHGS